MTQNDSSAEWQRAVAARDDALRRVDANAPEEWKRVAFAAVVEVARHQRELTSEHVRDLLDAHGIPEPHEPRAIGPVMRRAAHAGVIASTGRFTRYVRRSRHTGMTYVWESLISD